VAVDICENFNLVPYPMARDEDLEETSALLEKAGRTAIRVKADLRHLAALRTAVNVAVERFGRLDIVIANAGITSWWGDQSDDTAAEGDCSEIG
jgi:NAD(P)-dependent dehydrogenase (short-subunit alcohol dehydrogenase family)